MVQGKPSYPLASVDNALRLVQLLRDSGGLRLKDCADELGVAPSTAHRLLAMLVYRGFAIQDEHRNYVSGAAMADGLATGNGSRDLRLIVQPHLELLASRLNETSNLMIRVGTKVRFLSTVESTNILRVGDRRGAVLPARLASGGKALLAELEPGTLHKLFRHESDAVGDNLTEAEYSKLVGELKQVRSDGFASNFEETEDGISAMGMALHDGSGHGIAAISVAMPATRFRGMVDKGLSAIMAAAVREIEIDLEATRIEF